MLHRWRRISSSLRVSPSFGLSAPMAARKYWAVQLLISAEDKYLLLASGIVGFCPFDRSSSIETAFSLLERPSHEFSYLPSSFVIAIGAGLLPTP
ncbi:hypothetical protein N431DRAFT_183348 [Stipitochalara longipes BDJ]|nr:hypothetical protein N431DRAFT_183348 [Stipitochalara longipes BDJ]